jgi:hypothetical protein
MAFLSDIFVFSALFRIYDSREFLHIQRCYRLTSNIHFASHKKPFCINVRGYMRGLCPELLGGVPAFVLIDLKGTPSCK